MIQINRPSESEKVHLNATTIGVEEWCRRGSDAAATKLNFFFKRIVSVDASALQKFRDLEEINFSSNAIATLPEDVFAANTKLTKITLTYNDFTTLPGRLLQPLPELREFECGFNKINELDADFFQNNLKLEEIHLQSNNLTSLPPNLFKNLTNLKVLSVRLNKLEKFDFAELKSATNLTRLDISWNNLTELVDHEKYREWLPQLKVVTLSGNKFPALYLQSLIASFDQQDIKIEGMNRNTGGQDVWVYNLKSETNAEAEPNELNHANQVPATIVASS